MAKAKPIFIPGTNQQFASAAAAAKALGIDAGNISKVLKGKRKTAGGYSFGYTSNRVIYIPKTGQTFSSVKAAAKYAKSSPRKLEHILENNVDKTVGGFRFEYADSSKIPTVSVSDGRPSAVPKKNRKTNKKARQQQKRQKKQAKLERQKIKEELLRKSRAETSIKQAGKKQERIEQLRDVYTENKVTRALLSNEATELRALMEKVNAQLVKYQNANMMGYSKIAQDVEEFQNYLGFTENGLFDTSEENMLGLMENLSAEEINHWKNQLDLIADSKNGLFWDLNKQIKERQNYALEFGVSSEEMDAYIDLLPELWKIFEQARHSSMYEKVSQYMWTEIKSSVKSGISPQELKKVMGQLSTWNGSSSKELQEILGELEESIQLDSIFDDEDLPF